MSDPRRINLSLPADYLSKPAEKVRDWLRKNTASLRALGETEMVTRVRSALGAQITALNDGDIAVVVREWAKNNGIRLPGQAAGPGPGESEIVARVKKIFAAIPSAVEYKWSNGAAIVSVSGLTTQLNTGNRQHSVRRSWDGGLEFKTQTPGMAFTASASEKNWRLELAFGPLAPNLDEIGTVFTKGEAALRGALGSLDKVDWRNPSKTKQVFSPYLDPLKSAMEAASRAAKLRSGAASVSAWVGGSPSGGGAGGLQLTIVF